MTLLFTAGVSLLTATFSDADHVGVPSPAVEVSSLEPDSMTTLSPVDHYMLRELLLRIMATARDFMGMYSLVRSLDVRFPGHVLGIWKRPSFVDVYKGMINAGYVMDLRGIVTVAQKFEHELRHRHFDRCPVCEVFVSSVDECWMCDDIKYYAQLTEALQGCEFLFGDVKHLSIRIVHADAPLSALDGDIRDVVVPKGSLRTSRWNIRLSVRCAYYALPGGRFFRVFYSAGARYAAYLTAEEAIREAPTIPREFFSAR